MKKIQVALDGPSGSGKSSLAKRLSRDLGLYYIDTGALYRAVGLYLKECGVTPEDVSAIEAALADCRVSFDFVDGAQRTMLDGRDVSGLIRTPEIAQWASKTSALPAVRALLLSVQRDFARENSVIMDGRDIGTTILPDAPLKIFLTASAEERARRRLKELLEAGQEIDFETVLREQKERDHRDETREISPLRRAEDAVLVDTTALDFEESYLALRRVIEERMEKL
ncbi:MAG: (d)CMP kinase [Ruminococcaceae bacterium]|nr:(d)CMP kinase [Oscillospiraceae bacterium]